MHIIHTGFLEILMNVFIDLQHCYGVSGQTFANLFIYLDNHILGAKKASCNTPER